MIRRPPRSTLFPSTPLSRSVREPGGQDRGRDDEHDRGRGGDEHLVPPVPPARPDLGEQPFEDVRARLLRLGGDVGGGGRERTPPKPPPPLNTVARFFVEKKK